MHPEIVEWESAERPIPPPHAFKQELLKEYAVNYRLKTFVETGTLEGDMVAALNGIFDRIYSIELSPIYFEKAKKRFADFPQIEIIQGDSGLILKRLMDTLTKPTLFWLDGHFCGGDTAKGEKDTPVIQELESIFKSPDYGHVVIIDDMRYFGTDKDYPTVEEVKSLVLSHRPYVEFVIAYDIMRITSSRPEYAPIKKVMF